MGAGDLLMSFLGVVIISFGFRVYAQRDTMKRHFPEIAGATTLSSAFSLFSTALGAKALGLSQGEQGVQGKARVVSHATA
jgi:putative effector of murein hydrolase